MKNLYASNKRRWLAHMSKPLRGSCCGYCLTCEGIQPRLLRSDHYAPLQPRRVSKSFLTYNFRLWIPDNMIILENHAPFPTYDAATLSKESVSLIYASVEYCNCHKTDISRSSQSYPRGGPFGGRGSPNVGRGFSTEMKCRRAGWPSETCQFHWHPPYVQSFAISLSLLVINHEAWRLESNLKRNTHT
jgi:hypothetical protein